MLTQINSRSLSQQGIIATQEILQMVHFLILGQIGTKYQVLNTLRIEK